METMQGPNKKPTAGTRKQIALASWREEIAGVVRGQVRLDEPMSRRTSLGIGGPADLWFEPENAQDLSGALAIARRRRVPWRVVGAGSNLLVADEGFRGMVVHLRADFVPVEVGSRKDLVRVSYSAGMRCAAAHRHAAESELVGLEFLAGIPGSLGGAVRMNAGTRLGDMADVLEDVEVATADGCRSVPASELSLGYRKAAIPRGGIVTRVAVLLRQVDPNTLLSLRDRVRAETEWRDAAQPKGKSAGSTFKNPPGGSAGRMIDEAGLKGRRIGGAFVSEKHANFLMSDGKATAKDMLELIDLCRSEVEAMFKVRLELEIELLGVRDAD